MVDMKPNLIIAFLLVVGTIMGTADAGTSQRTIYLSCSFSHTVNLKDGTQGGTSGNTSLKIILSNDGKAVIERDQGLCRTFTGKASDMVIFGKCSSFLEDKSINIMESISVNRINGELQVTFGLENEPGLIHYASRCSG